MARNAKALQDKAKAIVASDGVASLNGGQWMVTSTTGSEYLVHTVGTGLQCTCRWARYHKTDLEPCTHVLAIEEYISKTGGRSLAWWSTKEAAQRQHRPVEYAGRGLLSTSRKV